MIKRRNLFRALLLLLGMWMVLLYSLKYGNGKSVEDVLGSCVRIQAKGHYGSGSILTIDANEITIVTNRHVLQYWDEDSYVTFFNGAVCNGRMIGVSELADVGFLHVFTGELLPEELDNIKSVEARKAGLKRGDWFVMADLASDLWNPVFYHGQILEPLKYLEEFGMDMVYGESAFKEGMSGCGVFDEDGKYIGMLTGGTDQNEIAAVPAKVVMSLYEDMEK